jgi:hypothetical protein
MVSIDGERTHRTPEEHESRLPARAMHPPHGISLGSLQRTDTAQPLALKVRVRGGDRQTKIIRQRPTAPAGALEGPLRMMMRQWDGVRRPHHWITGVGGQEVLEAKKTMEAGGQAIKTMGAGGQGSLEATEAGGRGILETVEAGGR